MTGDYMTDFILHGLKEMYGDEVLIKMTTMHELRFWIKHWKWVMIQE